MLLTEPRPTLAELLAKLEPAIAQDPQRFVDGLGFTLAISPGKYGTSLTNSQTGELIAVTLDEAIAVYKSVCLTHGIDPKAEAVVPDSERVPANPDSAITAVRLMPEGPREYVVDPRFDPKHLPFGIRVGIETHEGTAAPHYRADLASTHPGATPFVPMGVCGDTIPVLLHNLAGKFIQRQVEVGTYAPTPAEAIALLYGDEESPTEAIMFPIPASLRFQGGAWVFDMVNYETSQVETIQLVAIRGMDTVVYEKEGEESTRTPDVPSNVVPLRP